MTGPSAQERNVPEQGPTLQAFFSYGFRPFFLGSAGFAIVFMSLWIAWIVVTQGGSRAEWLDAFSLPYAWHAHEMVFGFVAAAIAGFLLTAVPNWTGALPLTGKPLAVLFFVWIAGRLAMLLPGLLPGIGIAIVDIAFLPALGLFAARQLLVKPAPRNLVFLVLLAILTIANGLFHARVQGLVHGDPLVSIRNALLVVAIMITIIGGRIVPAFTHNWLHLSGYSGPMPVRNARLDAASIISVAALALASSLALPKTVIGLLAVAATLSNLLRLALWRGWATTREPIVWVLHLGYLWLVIALALNAGAALGETVPVSLAYHAIGTGAAATMILAVMSRASLGHTGRPLAAPRPVVWSYYAITVAAMLRVFGPLILASQTPLLLVLSGLCWIAAFGLFSAHYAPILTGASVKTRLSPR